MTRRRYDGQAVGDGVKELVRTLARFVRENQEAEALAARVHNEEPVVDEAVSVADDDAGS